MKIQAPAFPEDPENTPFTTQKVERASEDDFWFLPGPVEEEPDYLPARPRTGQPESAVIEDWAKAEAAHAAHLATVAGRLGALDDRLLRGPEGWRHRLALIEAADLSWLAGDRISPDRLALWLSMRLSGMQDDPKSLARSQWAFRRLKGGPGPMDDLAVFQDRRDPETIEDGAERFEDRAGAWLDMMTAVSGLHAITRACMGYNLWCLAGLDQHGDQGEAAVTAARVAAGHGHGAVFAPLVMGGAGGLCVSGTPNDRLGLWLKCMENAVLAAMRNLDGLEAWSIRAENEMVSLSGRTPVALRYAMTQWPLVSAPMAEALTGASRAAVQRNMAWLEARGLVREVTGQSRFRMWQIVNQA